MTSKASTITMARDISTIFEGSFHMELESKYNTVTVKGPLRVSIRLFFYLLIDYSYYINEKSIQVMTTTDDLKNLKFVNK